MGSVVPRLIKLCPALLLTGCGRSVISWEGIYFPVWLIAFVVAIPPAILLGMPLQRSLAPEQRWTREPLEICLFLLGFVVVYFILTWPGASVPHGK